MHLLRANTAVDVLIGPFVDSTDGNTDETGLTITQADVRLSKNGQNMAQKNDANACTHDELGYYNCPLDATDTNTEGQLDIIVHESGALSVLMRCEVLSEAAWDSLFVAKDDGFMDVNIKTIGRSDTQETEANNLETACANYSATRGLSGTALPAAAADAAGGLPISDAGGLDLDAQIGTDIDAILTDTGTTIPGTITTMQGNVTDILADTNELQTDDIPTLIAALPTAAENRTEMDSNSTQLAAIVADTNELQTDLANGGRLDLILDELTSQGDTNETKLDTIITDTNELQTDLTNGGRLDLILDELTAQGDTNETKLDTVITDTNELQTDWTNGGRLDLIIDELTTQGDTNEGKIDTIDTNVDSVLTDTGTTLPASLTAIETDTQDIQSRIPAALVGGRMDSDVEAINNNTTAADNLAASALGIVSGSVNDAAATTTSFVSDLTEATNDHYNGRIIVFTSGAVAGQATDITDYDGSTFTITMTALTEAPANSVTFVIV